MERITAIRALPARGGRLLAGLLERSGARLLAACLGSMALGFLLAGGSVAGRAMPFAVCLIAASASPLRSLAALLGGSLGCLYFWGLSGGLEYMAAGILVFSARCIAERAEAGASRWLMPVLTTVLSLLVGLLFVIQARFAPGTLASFFARLALTFGSVRAYEAARTARTPSCLLYLLACTLSGCAALPLAGGVTLGQVLAVAVGAASLGTGRTILLCAAAGLAVDLTAPPPVSLTALLCFAGLCASAAPLRLRPARILVFLGAVVGGVLFTGGRTPELVPAAALGSCISLLIPASVFLERDGGRAVQRRLEQASLVLAEIHAMLDIPEQVSDIGAAAVFDRATDQVCGACVLWTQCWQRRSTETYHALCAVARPMLERGAAAREDFPPEFAESCCHLEGLIGAINREIEDQTSRRQYRRRLREFRAVLAEQYDFLASLLRRTAGGLGIQDMPLLLYEPELGVGAAGKGGSTVSGDRGACFQTGGIYYILLCDGMGAGEEAAAESRRAIRMLAGLLQAGQDPRRALETLNGVYILRGDGSFSTVDLLAASLVTGQATLYKWGAAPSYYRSARELKKIGTAAPPPGFGVGEAHKAEEHRLSLREGELLILLSDGAGGEEAGRRIAAWGDGSPKALAAALIDGSVTDGEDDRTAVVFRLHRRPPRLR